MFTAFPQRGAQDPAIQALFRFGQDRQTGLTGVTLTLTNAPVAGSLLLFKNGTLLDDPSAYTTDGRTVTLDVAAISGDVFLAHYHFTQTGTG